MKAAGMPGKTSCLRSQGRPAEAELKNRRRSSSSRIDSKREHIFSIVPGSAPPQKRRAGGQGDQRALQALARLAKTSGCLLQTTNSRLTAKQFSFRLPVHFAAKLAAGGLHAEDGRACPGGLGGPKPSAFSSPTTQRRQRRSAGVLPRPAPAAIGVQTASECGLPEAHDLLETRGAVVVATVDRAVASGGCVVGAATGLLGPFADAELPYAASDGLGRALLQAVLVNSGCTSA